MSGILLGVLLTLGIQFAAAALFIGIELYHDRWAEPDAGSGQPPHQW
jgi:hypothetical protein